MIDNKGVSRLVYSSTAYLSQGSFVLPTQQISILNIFWNPDPAIFTWDLPVLGRPVLWYGFFFALGFFLGYFVFQDLLKEFLKPYRLCSKAIYKFSEKIPIYIVTGTIIGARLGDVLFYQSFNLYANDLLGIFKFWQGGLSSHGGVVGILISVGLLRKRIKKAFPMLTWIVLLDLLCIPALLAGGFIRIGNFFNQEIVGTATTVPWAVFFQNPADGLPIVPRHPVQLYEALFYFSFFVLLLFLRKRNSKMFQIGKTSGLFFIGTFLFRFFIEFFKVKQSILIKGMNSIDMGQWLSIPLLIVGMILFFGGQKRFRINFVKRYKG